MTTPNIATSIPQPSVQLASTGSDVSRPQPYYMMAS